MSPSDIPAIGATPGPEGSPLPGKKLDSWGEIASYLGREVRTVQRWEKTEGLPVRRHEHQRKSTVYAYSRELDAWVKKRQPKDDPVADAAFVPEPDLVDDPDIVVPAPNQGPPASSVGKLVVVSLFGFAILCLLFLVVYRWLHPADASQSSIRIAVLPFSYAGSDSKPDYITEGLADVIRTSLTQLNPTYMKVIASTSSKIVGGRSIKEIGRDLNVQYVLEGNVQNVGNQARIDVQLIQVSDETHLWAESFTRELSDLLRVQSDVSGVIDRQVLATLPLPPVSKPETPVRGSPNPVVTPEIARARHAYHQGKFAWGSRGDLRSSIKFFDAAIHDDPNYAEAYAGLAGATAILGQVPNDGLPPSEAKPKAREAAQKALQLNPRLADVHAVLGNVAMSYDWDLATAEKELRRAIELNPNDPTPHEWYCHLLIVEGHNSEALAEINHSLDLDQLNPLFHAVLAETFYFGRNFDGAIEEAAQVVKLHPGSLSAQFWLGSAYREKKMYPQAIETFQNAREQARKLTGSENPAFLMAYGHTQALAGNAAEARAVLQQLRQLAALRFVPSLYPAAIHVGLGEYDQAFQLLELTYQERIDRLVYLNVDPMADPLRHDPRFAQLMGKVGFH